MRRALLRQLPALTAFYGLTPADIDHMSLREVTEYVAQHRAHMAKQGG